MNENDIKEIKHLLDIAENNIRQAKGLIFSSGVEEKAQSLNVSEDGKIVEGIFDGEIMISADKKKYPVPPNYASKSKLVPGDVLKLTIANDGTFLFKQINPVKRKKIVASLEEIDKGKYIAKVGDQRYNLLLASVTYFKAKVDDKLTILIPEEGHSDWAAVENVIEDNTL